MLEAELRTVVLEQRILLEAATESEWVAQPPEGLGHGVIVAGLNYGAIRR